MRILNRLTNSTRRVNPFQAPVSRYMALSRLDESPALGSVRGQRVSLIRAQPVIILTLQSLFGKKYVVDLEKIKNAALAAAARAGDILLQHRGKAHIVEKKGAIDLVTEADIASEKAITEIIRTTFPEHSIHAEESGIANKRGPYTWIIDPLDGTTNYAHGLPEFSVSIAFAHEQDPVFGLVLNPVTRELFCGMRNHGAWLNGNPIHVSRTTRLRDALLVTGFPYDLPSVIDPVIARLKQCLLAAQGIRRLGSAALDLCYLACGRFDGFWEQNLAPWDTAAGVVIAREAGATISDFINEPYTLTKKEILATNGLIHEDMARLLRTE